MPNNDIQGGYERWFVDPDRGFVVTGGEHHDGTAVYRRFKMSIENVGDDLWVPTEIIDYNVISADADRVVVSDLQVNPELTDEDFRVRFPIGTQIDDFIVRAPRQTTLIGTAFNDETDGPYLETDATIVFITGIDAWPDDVIGQSVTVTGTIMSFLIQDSGDTLRTQQLEVASWSRSEDVTTKAE